MAEPQRFVAIDFTEAELRQWCEDHAVDRRSVTKADRREHVLGLRGGRLIFGYTGASELGTLTECHLRGIR